MTALHYYRNNDGDMEHVVTVLRWVYTGQARAEEGQAGTWEVFVDDPDMTLDFVGHRRWIIYEDDSDDANEVVVDGLTQGVRFAHSGGDVTNPVGRVVIVEIADLNTLFQYRVMIGSDSQRPEETDVERVTAIANSEEMGYFDDLSFISAGSPVDMEEENVRGQYTHQVFDSCAQDTGKNWYIFSTGDHVSGTDIALWYGRDSLDTRTSPLSLSNDPADLDMQAVNDGTATTYPLGADTELRRDYGRQYSGAYGTFQGGAKYIPDDENPYDPNITLGGRDVVHPAPEIRSRARMKRRLLRVLRDHATPDEVIKTTPVVPANKVSQLGAGMRIATTATHLPNYESGGYLRILSAAPRPIGRKAGVDMYSVALELQGPASGANPDECEVMGRDYTDANPATAYDIPVGNTPSGSYTYNSADGGQFGDFVSPGTQGRVFYLSAGGGAARVRPIPGAPADATGWGGGWAFSDYGAAKGGMPDGNADGGLGGSEGAAKLQIMVVGPGELTIWATSNSDAHWVLYRIDTSGAPGNFSEDATAIDSGDMSYPSTVIDVPDDGECLHCVIVYDDGPSSPSTDALYYGGHDWVAS
jgi:hypothetical protein